MSQVPDHQLDARSRPKRCSTVASVELDGETVLYDSATESIHRLNETATLVWVCLDGTGSLAEVVDALAVATGADSATVAEDVLILVRELSAKGLVEDARDGNADD
jgi:hypothetical protein